MLVGVGGGQVSDRRQFLRGVDSFHVAFPQHPDVAFVQRF
jgi:hypothetical protein